MLPTLSVRMLSKTYGGKPALDHVSLDVGAGEILGLLGPNGAGKSTLLNIVVGLLPPDSGEVRVLGQSTADRRPRAGVLGYVPAMGASRPGFTGLDFVRYMAGLMDLSWARVERHALHMLATWEVEAHTLLESLSDGGRVKVALTVAFLASPRIVVLDEPFAHLDVRAARRLELALRRFARGGGTVVATSHDLLRMELLCDRVVLIDRGHLLADGAPRDLVRQNALGDSRNLLDVYTALTEAEHAQDPDPLACLPAEPAG